MLHVLRPVLAGVRRGAAGAGHLLARRSPRCQGRHASHVYCYTEKATAFSRDRKIESPTSVHTNYKWIFNIQFKHFNIIKHGQTLLTCLLEGEGGACGRGSRRVRRRVRLGDQPGRARGAGVAAGAGGALALPPPGGVLPAGAPPGGLGLPAPAAVAPRPPLHSQLRHLLVLETHAQAAPHHGAAQTTGTDQTSQCKLIQIIAAVRGGCRVDGAGAGLGPGRGGGRGGGQPAPVRGAGGGGAAPLHRGRAADQLGTSWDILAPPSYHRP